MNIYESTTTNFQNNGLGFLTDIISAKVTEELNGEYTLEFEYVRDGALSEYLIEENIIKTKTADGTYQLFRINNVKKNFNTIKITAYHIFYDLLNNFIEDTYPQDLNAQLFLNHILSHTQFTNSFIGISDINDTKSARYVRKNPVAAIMGDIDNSMVNLFGGELKRDNFNINFLSRVGQNKGVKLIIGKNITGIDITIDITGMATKIMPQGYDGLLLPEKYVDSPLINNYPTPKIAKIEFSEVKYDPEDEEAYHTLTAAYDALRALARKQFDNGIDKPSVNVKIDWIELSKTNEYKQYENLESVGLGDTLTANILGLDYETRVIKIEYNPLTDMIDKFEIGTFNPSLEKTMNKITQSMEDINPSSILEEAKENATNLINTAMGGYIYKTQSELYIMDTNDPTTATKVWRWNINGLGYSSTGINGTYGIAMTMDGSIVADFITSGTIRANLVEGMDSLTLQVENNTNKFDDYYDKSSVDTLLQSAESGITNTFSEAGGNNIFRNTGLWFENSRSDSSINPYEYWFGNVVKIKEENASNMVALLLQNGTLYQEQKVPNGNYTISFKYKKLIELANIRVSINDVIYNLLSTQETEIIKTINVNSQHINIKFLTDINNSCEIFDIMVNAGSVKLAYSQNQNETTTDTINISKGMTITSTDTNTKFKADSDGIRVLNKNSGEVKTKFLDTGMETDEATIKNKATIVKTLYQDVNNHTWITRL